MRFVRAFPLIPAMAWLSIMLNACSLDCKEEREVMILGINDVYRIEGVDGQKTGGMGRVRALRKELEQKFPDLLFLHAGDFLFPSLLSDWSKGAHMINTMNALDGVGKGYDSQMLVVFGNHEFDKTKINDAANLQQLINRSEFDWLGSNVVFTEQDGRTLVTSKHLKTSVLRESGGVRVGIFGLVTDARPASSIEYVDRILDPIEIARSQTFELRKKGAKLVIGLTHLPIDRDLEILETLGEEGPDLIIGGHEHERHHVDVNGRWIVKADSDARTAMVVRVRMGKAGARPFVSVGYRFLDEQQIDPDPEMQSIVDNTLKEHESWFCEQHSEGTDCLEQAVGETGVPLIGEELEIRGYETNLGNWVADQMRAAFEKADIAFVNAGSIRLNQNIPSGPIIRRNIEELLPYDNALVQMAMDKKQLRQVLEWATENWTGEGHWLQISGFAFEHNPNLPPNQRVGRINLIRDGKAEPIADDQILTVVTNEYLCAGNDGFDLLKAIPCGSDKIDLKPYLLKTLASEKEPIKPETEGRICNIPEKDKRICKFEFSDNNPLKRSTDVANTSTNAAQ